ncbi:putative adhesive serine protease, partial [Danaus plexippus plexippus]
MFSQINHMEFYKNITRPSKSFSSFSNNYFNQLPKGKEKVQCGTRTVDYTLRRGKIVGGSEAPYGAFPWQ